MRPGAKVRFIFRAASLIALLLAAACSRRSEPPDAGRREPDPAQPDEEVDAGAPRRERPPLPVAFDEPDAGDLAAEVRSFHDLESCAAGIQGRVPPALREVLGDIGYDRASLDACRARQALAQQEIEVCDELTLRAARLGCRRRYAMFHGRPDLCPREPIHDGRDPTCVAVAMRDPTMCQAAVRPDLVGLCRAIVLRGERPCRVAHQTLVAVNRCARAASRWWTALPPSHPPYKLPVGFEPELTLCAEPPSGEIDGGPEAGADAGADAGTAGCRTNDYLVRRGIVLGPDEGLVIGGRKGLPIGPRRPLIELRLPLPEPEVELPVSLEDVPLWVDLRGHPIWTDGHEVEGGEVELERFGPERGDIVSGTYEADFVHPDHGPVHLRGTFRTFVRDVVRAPHRTRRGDGPDAGSGRSDPRGSSPP